MASEGKRGKPYGPMDREEAPRSAVEREQSPVAGQGPSGRQTAAIAIACVLGAGVVLIALRSSGPHHTHHAKKQSAVSAGGVGQPFQNHAGANQGQPGLKAASIPLPSKSSGHGGFHNPFLHSNQESPALKALKAPIMAYNGHASTAPQKAASTHQTAGSSAVAPHAAKSSLGKALKADHFSAASAHVIAHPNFTIAAGTIIPCTLETAINSGLPGFVKCVLPQPVRSMTGAVTLLDKGTQVMGEVRHGLTQGQDRLFILWTRAITPQDVAVKLSSPAAGALGEPGISGSVDNHFLDRFGAAIMMSVIGGSLQAASNATQHGAGNSYFQYVNQNTNQIANTALQSTINIPPTLKRPQGANVSIFVARDLNFSNVYKLSLVKH